MAVEFIVQGRFRDLPQHGQVPQTGGFLVFGAKGNGLVVSELVRGVAGGIS
jgi:hypothetical protein